MHPGVIWDLARRSEEAMTWRWEAQWFVAVPPPKHQINPVAAVYPVAVSLNETLKPSVFALGEPFFFFFLQHKLNAWRVTIVHEILSKARFFKPKMPHFNLPDCLLAVNVGRICADPSLLKPCKFVIWLKASQGHFLWLLLRNVWGVNYKTFPKSWIITLKRGWSDEKSWSV